MCKLTFMIPEHMKNIPFNTGLNSQLRQTMSDNDMVFSILGSCLTNVQPIDNPEQVKKVMNEKISKCVPTLLPKTKYRGLSDLPQDVFDAMKNYKVGEVVVPDNGFAYVTSTKSGAEHFIKGGNNSVLMKIKLPWFTKLSRSLTIIPYINNGAISWKDPEAMLKAGAKYKVLSNQLGKDGILNLVLRYVK